MNKSTPGSSTVRLLERPNKHKATRTCDQGAPRRGGMAASVFIPTAGAAAGDDRQEHVGPRSTIFPRSSILQRSSILPRSSIRARSGIRPRSSIRPLAFRHAAHLKRKLQNMRLYLVYPVFLSQHAKNPTRQRPIVFVRLFSWLRSSHLLVDPF